MERQFEYIRVEFDWHDVEALNRYATKGWRVKFDGYVRHIGRETYTEHFVLLEREIGRPGA